MVHLFSDVQPPNASEMLPHFELYELRGHTVQLQSHHVQDLFNAQNLLFRQWSPDLLATSLSLSFSSICLAWK